MIQRRKCRICVRNLVVLSRKFKKNYLSCLKYKNVLSEISSAVLSMFHRILFLLKMSTNNNSQNIRSRIVFGPDRPYTVTL